MGCYPSYLMIVLNEVPSGLNIFTHNGNVVATLQRCEMHGIQRIHTNIHKYIQIHYNFEIQLEIYKGQ